MHVRGELFQEIHLETSRGVANPHRDFSLLQKWNTPYNSYGKMQIGESEKRRSETLCFPVPNGGPKGPKSQKVSSRPRVA